MYWLFRRGRVAWRWLPRAETQAPRQCVASVCSAPEGLSAGDMVQLDNGMPAIVVSVADDAVEIDVNHPLAGKTLTFDMEMVSVE